MVLKYNITDNPQRNKLSFGKNPRIKFKESPWPTNQ